MTKPVPVHNGFVISISNFYAELHEEGIYTKQNVGLPH